MSSMRRKKPCRFCHKWFTPDPRVGARQIACSNTQCQAKRKRVQEASWRHSNPDYFTARRLQDLGSGREGEREAGADGPTVDPPSPRRPLDRLPWDLAQTQFGVQRVGFLAILAGVLLRHAQTQMRRHLLETKGKSVGLLPCTPETQIGASSSVSFGVSAGGDGDVVRCVPGG